MIEQLRTLWHEHQDTAASFAVIAANVGVALLPNNFAAPFNWIVAGFSLGGWASRRRLDRSFRETEGLANQLTAMISSMPDHVQRLAQVIIDNFIVQLKQDGHLPPGFDAKLTIRREPFDPSEPTPNKTVH